MILHEIDTAFDVIDQKYIDSIRESSREVFKHYLKTGLKNTDKIPTDHGLQEFWAYLGTMTFSEFKNAKINLHILPLDRVEAAQGASGSRVFVSYFSLTNNKENHYSNPLILKYQDMGLDTSRDKLIQEKNQADSIRPFVRDRGNYYAFPVVYKRIKKIGILWAPFSSSVFSKTGKQDGQKPVLKEDNLWKAFDKLNLDCSDTSAVKKITNCFNNLYEVLYPIHTKDSKPVRKLKSLRLEYKWYLRNDLWLPAFEKIWGDKKKLKVDDFGKKWINPVYVYHELKTYKKKITMGCIHGDLHTKNIVFAPGSNLRIIDFGWTQDFAHIAKDFILLESNLRFMILHPDVPYHDLLLLCKTLDESNTDPSLYQCEYSRFIHDRIIEVRQKAKKVLDENNMFAEYYIPLFFLCLGLLNFTKSFNNVTNARLTILHLAEMIHNHLK